MPEPQQPVPNAPWQDSPMSQSGQQPMQQPMPQQAMPLQPAAQQPAEQQPMVSLYQTAQDAGQPVAPVPPTQQPVPPVQPDGASNGTVPPKKPIWKKWWFWVLIVLALGIIGGMGGGSDNSPSPSATTTQSETRDKSTEEKKKPEKKTLESISVEYSGTNVAGTQIDANTMGITVTAHYSDDSTSYIDRGKWELTNPAVLASGQTQTFTVKFEDKTADFTITVPESEADYKARAENIPYADMARNPDTYMGHTVHFHGKIIQVIEGSDGDDSQYRISVTQGAYGIWDDTVFVQFKTDPNQRFLEDDIVEFWGDSLGTITYQSTLGGNITIPAVYAKYMQLAQ